MTSAGYEALRDGAFGESGGFLDRAIALAEPVDRGTRRTENRDTMRSTSRRRGGPAGGGSPPRLDTGSGTSTRAGTWPRRRRCARPSDRPATASRWAQPSDAGGHPAASPAVARGVSSIARPRVEHERLRRATLAYLNLAELNYLASRKGRSAYAAPRALNLAEQAGPRWPSWRRTAPSASSAVLSAGTAWPIATLDWAGRRQRRIGQPYATAINLHQVCLYRSGTGPAGRLFADYETGVGLFRSLGDKGRLRDCLGLAGIAAHLFGRLDLGRRFLEELLATHDEGERSLPWTWGVTWLAAIDLRQGHTDEALAGLRRAIASQGSERLDMTSITVHGLLSVALLRVGRVDEARIEADRTRSLIAATGGHPSGHPVLDGYTGLAEVRLASWDAATSSAERDRARRQLEEACLSLDRYRRVFPIGEPAFRLYRGHLAARVGRQRPRAGVETQPEFAAEATRHAVRHRAAPISLSAPRSRPSRRRARLAPRCGERRADGDGHTGRRPGSGRHPSGGSVRP